MHYYGTYALARAAGIKPEAAQIIASASQFVDDNAKKENIDFTDKACLISRPTAHHCEDVKNILPDDQRVVWVPFHFLPGGEGRTFNERIVCTQDSEIARKMVANHLSKTDKDFYQQLIGITAHVYADTFSHYGFSGMSSDVNDVDTLSIELVANADPNIFNNLKDKACHFLEKLKTGAAEFGSRKLGHGGVYTYPDQPFLKWNFKYENGTPSNRNNLQTFMDGSEAIYNLFRAACETDKSIYEGKHRNFSQIKASLQEILSYPEHDEDKRCENWIKSFENETSNFTEGAEIMPEYLGDVWNGERKALDNNAHSSLILQSPVYNFYKAASYHRHFVLRDLLPKYDIVVA
ncbi:DUF6765 family protein [Maridesulfovibrio sp.]|uniref:DUF6765 family protein n=1 Tax=Maridesulfovibrio sp. TaxID=2795000 RepID=UPI002A18E853|nr:DUF6765 family protein [Maridesulfovibrio sp.]